MAMKIKECCCGGSLHTGTVMIALSLLVWSVMVTFSLSGQLNYLPTHVDDQPGVPVENKIQHGEHYKDLKVGLTSGIVCWAVQSILNTLLLIGVFQEKRILVTIWLVAYTAICGLCFLGLVVCFFMLPFFLLLHFALGTYTGLLLYFMLVVWSFHNSSEAGYNRVQRAADVYDIENCNIKRMPLENPL